MAYSYGAAGRQWVLAIGLIFGVWDAQAAETASRVASRPAVVELFTSEGCSSCPPADAFLGELAQRPGLITLAYHVDYWDGLGWKDPFASAAATDRQRTYARALSLQSVYTPQMVVDGRFDAVGSDRAAVLPLLAGGTDGVGVQMHRDGAKLSIDLSATNQAEPMEILALAVSDRVQTTVARGENAGRVLSEYSIVRGLYPLGVWNGEATSISLPLTGALERATSVVVLIQQQGQGPIVGAASTALH